jgi:hypothetical protein
MDFSDFRGASLKLWNQYLSTVYVEALRRRLGYGMLMYPNIALFTETDNHFIMELFGADRSFSQLTERLHKNSSAEGYFYQFQPGQGGPDFSVDGQVELRNLLFSREADYDAVRQRFHFVDLWPTKLNFEVGKGGVLSFKASLKSRTISRTCLLVNRYEEIYRAKHILLAIIAGKSLTQNEYGDFLSDKLYQAWTTTDDLYGVHYIRGYDEAYALSGQFSNLFLMPGLRETTMGEFLNRNPEFIRKAFSCKRYLYEKEFDWIEGNPDPTEKSIRPDLMVSRDDGFFDICDLKTALLDRSSVTRDEHNRRRFIDVVYEGVAQLANYEDYFKHDANRRFADEKYGAKIDNPSLYLIVGSYENSSSEEIEEASRSLRSNFRIIDYDTLNAMFLGRYKRQNPESQ